MPKQQVKLIADEEEVQTVKRQLGIPEAVEDQYWKIQQQERPYVSGKLRDVRMENYAMVGGTLEEGNLKLTVVTVYDLSHAKEAPDLIATDNELDVWRQHLLAYISQTSERLGMALNLIVR